MRTKTSAAHRATACRAVLIFMLSSAAQVRAAEPVPFLELTYGAAEGLMPPAPVGEWWRETVVESAVWWGATSNTPVDGAVALSNLRILRILVSGVPAADGQLTPAIAIWVREAVPLLGPTLATVAARWPGYSAQDEGGASILRGPLAIPAAQSEPPPGLRIALRGAGLAEELRRRVSSDQPTGLSAEDLAARLAEAARWNPVAGIEPGPGGPHGWLDTGLPDRWFKAVDPAVVGRLPAGTSAWAAIGIDGGHLREDLATDPARAAMTGAWLATLIPLLQPTAVAAALDGTWLVARSGDAAFARAPRSPELDAILAGLAAIAGVRVPVDEVAVELDSGIFWARAPHEWVAATSPEAVAAWFAATPRLAVTVPDGALLIGQASQGMTSAALAECEPVLPWWEPLPARAGSPSQLSRELGARGKDAPFAWPQMAAALDGAGDHRIVGQAAEGHLRCALEGPLLPWLIPGFAIRWCADHAQDEEGRVRLRAEIARLRADGQAVTPGDLVAALPAVAPERIGAWSAQVAVAGRAQGLPFQPMQKRLGDEPLPWPEGDADRQLLNQGRKLVEATAGLDEPGLPGGGVLDLLTEPAAARRSFDFRMPHLAAARALASLGMVLVSHGDRRGVILADRAGRLVQAPQNTIGLFSQLGICAQRDNAWLVTLVATDPERVALDRWLGEAPQELDCASTWRGERVFMTGRAAACWLDQGAVPAAISGAALVAPILRMGLLQSHALRGPTAAELALMMAYQRQLERGERAPLAGMEDLGSPLTSMVMQDIGMTYVQMRTAQAKQVLTRLAARLQLLARDGKLPRTPVQALAVLGRLDCPFGSTMVPLTYQFLADHAFRLFVSDQVPPPVGMQPKLWQRMLAAEVVAPGRHVVVPGRVLEVVIDPRLAPEERKGADGF